MQMAHEASNTTKVLAQFTNTEDGMTAFVVESHIGGFGVSLRDDDSGLFAPLSTHGIKTFDAAVKMAKELL